MLSGLVVGRGGTSGECFLTITFSISSVKYRVYFLVVYLFFPRYRIDFQKMHVDAGELRHVHAAQGSVHSCHEPLQGLLRRVVFPTRTSLLKS